MTQNIGTRDRTVRAVASLVFFACTVAAPFPIHVRIFAFAIPGIYMMGTVLVGTCVGYKLMGRSTCAQPTHHRT